MSSRNRKHREPSPEALLRLADRTEILDDRIVQRLVAAAAITTNTRLQRRIEAVLAVKGIGNHRQPFDTDPPFRSPVADQVALGTTITGSAFDLDQDDLGQHLLAIGLTLLWSQLEFINKPR